MSAPLLFNRFELAQELSQDDVYRCLKVRDTRQDHSSVLLMVLQERWQKNPTLMREVQEYFDRLQGVRHAGVNRVLTVSHHPVDGFGVAFEWPGHHRLSESQPESTEFTPLELAEQLCEALHKSHMKGVYHGHLRVDDIWVNGKTLVLTGFGYLPVLVNGWKDPAIQVAPELQAGGAIGPPVDVFALALVFIELFPDHRKEMVLQDAQSSEVGQRVQKIRDFEAQLHRLLGPKKKSGVVPKEDFLPSRENPTTGLRPKGETKDLPVDKDTEEKKTEKKKPNPDNSNTGGEQMKGEEELRKLVHTSVFDNYCDRQTERALIRDGMEKWGLDRQDAQIIVEMELETIGAANERKLINELEGLLDQFVNDEKLSERRWKDAREYISNRGLKHQIVEQQITEYCRKRRVMVKKGWFGWKVP